MKTKNEIRKKLWSKREGEGKCIYCGINSVEELTTKGCTICLEKKSKSQIKFSQNNKESTKKYRKKIRKEVIDKYGGKCVCCGETELLFLTIDHKNNDGNLERIEMSGDQSGSSMKFFFKIRKEPIREDLQILCFNCNLGRSMNDGICPHHKPSPESYDTEIDLRRKRNNDVGCKIVWPENEELISKINEIGLMSVAKELGVDHTAIRGRLKRRGLYELVNKYGNVK